MSARCLGCADNARRIGVVCSRGKRICRVVDVTLIHRYPRRSIDALKAINLANALGSRLAANYVGQLEKFPDSPSAAIALVLAIHKFIFTEGEPQIAGRFRGPDEIGFYGHGPNEREGFESQEIAKQLATLFASLRGNPSLIGRRGLALCLARFFERFFVIHPFVDSNGRVARFIAELVTRETGRWRWNQEMANSAHKRWYVQSLAFAHMHTPSNLDPRCDRRKNPLGPLSRWVDKQLIEAETDWDIISDDEAES